MHRNTGFNNQKLKSYPYETIKGNKNLNDTYAEDLTLFLKLFPHDQQKTKTNIKYALDSFDKFYNWSGLKMNKNKTYINIFGKISPEPTQVNDLGLNYCNDFTLLGIKLDSTLKSMIFNYNEGIRKLETVVNDWRHKYLNFFGKITVVKTFMLSVLSHIATVLPTRLGSIVKKLKQLLSTLLKVSKPHQQMTRLQK